ncbi:flavodoxin-like protein [Arthrobacter crystallopoietes BAB-32]|uniref:Flavodoxin-like protein n=1 Tax=Arthrobacter crystallopoietes BAB-32 TaxID=1246476 RepID=N1UP96_9MICC|nr:flavodoxin domain-containing protein [Arthrobacter crystallopoietes]EMY32241.1 flavodoxin-like protein [Arthrobacter crystallopoietes BAB-32]
MRVLIGYSSAHGSTAEIARRIGELLEQDGLAVDTLAIPQITDLHGYDAVVLGSAIHQQAWMPEAAEFVHRHAAELLARLVWLFSVGMSDALPRLVRGAARTGQDRRLAQALRDVVHPRGHRLFSGVAQAEQFPAWIRVLFRCAGGRFGDFRDWVQIEAWARGIAEGVRSSRSGQQPAQ